MSEILVGLIPGFIFGLGLCLSGLADPSVVHGFLDVADAWNPALLFVMGVGLTTAAISRLSHGRAGKASCQGRGRSNCGGRHPIAF